MPAIIDSNAMQSIFEPPKPNGSYEGPFLSYFRSVGKMRPILLLAFAPKAAGTFFAQAAIEALGGQLFRASHALGGRDCTPYLPNFLARYLDAKGPPPIVLGHMQAFAANRNFLDMFGLKPVIMIRNIPDMLASFWDMLEIDPIARSDGLNCVVPENFVSLSRDEKAGFMIDMIAPWYASYFATWKTVSDEAPQAVCVLRYKDFCARPSAALHKALAHSGFALSPSKCDAAIASVWTQKEFVRFNKGIGGRGNTYFPPYCLERLSRMLAHYPQLKPWLADLNEAATPFVERRDTGGLPNALKPVALKRRLQ